MATIEKAAEIIDANPDLGQFAGPVPFEEIWVAESRLGLRFPDSYREFLQKYGAGQYGGEPIYGLGVPDVSLPNVVWATETMRTADDFFPGDLVPIQDTGAGDVLCLVTSRIGDDGECPVIEWFPEVSLDEQTLDVINKTFAHFLLAVARRALK